MPVISIADREKLWNEYNRARHKYPRICAGAWWYLLHRLTRWWKVSPGIAILQLLYFIGIGALAYIAFIDAKPRSSPFQWHKSVAVAAAVVIGWYKTTSGKAGKPQEAERRQAVRSLLSRMNQSQAVDHARLGNQHEARLKELCECVRRDVQEFLEIPESDVSVLVLEHIRDPDQDENSGFLQEIARDRPSPRGFFANGPRPPLECFAYEAIRRRRISAFHDLKSVNLVEIFGEWQVDYRSVFCLPLVRDNAEAPFGILSVKFKYPYLLWPKLDDKLDRRLSLYLELIRMFIPER